MVPAALAERGRALRAAADTARPAATGIADAVAALAGAGLPRAGRAAEDLAARWGRAVPAWLAELGAHADALTAGARDTATADAEVAAALPAPLGPSSPVRSRDAR